MNTRICRDVKRSEIIPKYDPTNLTPFLMDMTIVSGIKKS